MKFINIFKSFIFFLLVFSVLSGCSTKKHIPEQNYRIIDSNCAESNFNDIIEKAKDVDVVIFGEGHTDKTAHEMELKILKALNEIKGKKVVLTMEMFERDVQTVLDEYMNDLISEMHFIWSSRAWGNYRRDYRPMIEYAKKEKLKVIAANAPRRYVNLVSRKGKESLNQLSDQAKKWIAPLPYGSHNEKYIKKIEELNKLLMEKHPDTGKARGFQGINPDAQLVWDITMAHSIIKALDGDKSGKTLVFQVNGKFHSEENMGIPDFLRFYKKDIKILIVTAISYKDTDKKQPCDKGDFIIITDLSG